MDPNQKPEEQEEMVEEHVEQPLEDVQQPVQEAVKAEPKQEIPQKLVQQTQQIGAPVPGRLDKLKAFIVECKRVLRVTKKPNKQEYMTIVKVSAIGMAIIGVIGFLIHFIEQIIF